MPKRRATTKREPVAAAKGGGYDAFLSGLSRLLEEARRSAARAVNSVLTATYWEVGRRIVEFEQAGKARAEYGEGLLKRLSVDLTTKYGRGFSKRNLEQMRAFFLGWPICELSRGQFPARASIEGTAAGEFKKAQTPSAQLDASLAGGLMAAFPLAWSHYIRLLAVEDSQARAFYETEAVRGGWSVRQLDRQISTQFYERLAHSKRKSQLLEKAHVALPEDAVSVEDVVRDPYLLEFLDLRDEYSESDLEAAIVRHLEWFLLEMGWGFTFVARQKRVRVGDTWYRIDLLLYHRDLRCLVVVDLKIGKFSHADAGQMNLYLNYVGEHLTRPSENPPVGIILCSEKDDAVVKYATRGIQAKVFASKYLKVLPDPEKLRQEIVNTQRVLALHVKENHRPDYD